MSDQNDGEETWQDVDAVEISISVLATDEFLDDDENIDRILTAVSQASNEQKPTLGEILQERLDQMDLPVKVGADRLLREYEKVRDSIKNEE